MLSESRSTLAERVAAADRLLHRPVPPQTAVCRAAPSSCRICYQSAFTQATGWQAQNTRIVATSDTVGRAAGLIGRGGHAGPRRLGFE